MTGSETFVTVIFSLCSIGSAKLPRLYSTTNLNSNPSISFLSKISTHLEDVSTLSSHPLVQTFTSQFLKEIQNKPEWSLAFNFANFPALEAGKAIQQIYLPMLQRCGCPQADLIVQNSVEGSVATFDSIDSNQFQTVVGNMYAKYLLNHGRLASENVSQHAKALAEEIGKNTQIVKPVDKYGYVKVLINTSESFLNRLGLKFDNDFATEANDLFYKECACVKYKMCI